MRILTYGLPADAVDEYVQIGESTARESLDHFHREVIDVFDKEYLRSSNTADVARLLQEGETRGFPGMLGSIDCMHWEWSHCLSAWKDFFTERGKHPSMILEAATSHDLWIWHAYFGLPVSCNDINILQRSPIFLAYEQGGSPPVQFIVNRWTYDIGYYLADGIYPEWSAFMKTVPHLTDSKKQYFTKVKRSARKDIERAFRVLQARCGVICGPMYGWDRQRLSDIMIAHPYTNMIVVVERGPMVTNTNFDYIDTQINPAVAR
jgi:hypothetical protein